MTLPPDYPMNNFWFYLPRGPHRASIEEAEPDRLAVICTMDRLLKREFKNIDTNRIYQTMFQYNQAYLKLSYQERRNEEVVMGLEGLLQESHRAFEELRPLFNKLVDMGFDPNYLSR